MLVTMYINNRDKEQPKAVGIQIKCDKIMIHDHIFRFCCYIPPQHSELLQSLKIPCNVFPSLGVVPCICFFKIACISRGINRVEDELPDKVQAEKIWKENFSIVYKVE